MSTLTFEQVVAAFPNGKWVKDEWVTRCPAHKDRNHPNLHIGRGDKQPVVYNCTAGCSQDAVDKMVRKVVAAAKPVPASDPLPTKRSETKIHDRDELKARLEKYQESAEKSPEFAEFIAARGISPETARERGLGIGEYYGLGTCIVIPYFEGAFREVMALKFRALKPSEGKKWRFDKSYTGYRLFNHDLLCTRRALDSDTPLFVVESELDAILMLDKGQDAVSIDSANHKLTDEDRDLLRSVKNITLMLDQDEAGHKAAKRLLAEIPSAKALLVFGGGKDVGELWNACAPSDQPRRIRYEVTGLTDWPELVVGVVIDTPPEASVVALDDMPTSVLDGWLGDLCRTRLADFPVAYAWPALVAVAGSMVPRPDARSPRVNLYASLVGPKGSGKSTAIEYAGKLLGIDGATLVKMMVGSPEGLVKHLGGGSRLLSVDELGHLLSKAQIQGSTFSYVLNRAFYDDEFDVVMAKKIKETFSCHLSVLGGMVDELFQDGFGSATTGGLHDRFIFGQCPTGFVYHYRPFEGDSAEIENDAFGKACRPVPVTIDDSVWTERDRWIDELKIAPRVSELAIRVATICASWDGRSTLTAATLGPALEFAQYQMRARVLLQPNAGENFEARIALKMLSYLKRHAPNGELVSRRKMFLDINAHKIGLSIAKKALEALAFNGDVILSKNGKMPVVRLVTQ